jgi:hypothetical protein
VLDGRTRVLCSDGVDVTAHFHGGAGRVGPGASPRHPPGDSESQEPLLRGGLHPPRQLRRQACTWRRGHSGAAEAQRHPSQNRDRLLGGDT